MGISGSNRIVTFACVVCSVGCNAAEFLVRWNLVEQIWQNGRIPDTAACDLNCSYLQCLFINPYMYLTPQDVSYATGGVWDRRACGRSILPRLQL
jgi:hypothetical protein